MNESGKTILLLGGTGHYGRRIVSSLLKKGVKVRVLTRNAEKARAILGADAELKSGDIASAGDVSAAVRGVDGLVVSVSAFSPQLIRRLKEIELDAVLAAFDAARNAGVKRVVYVSVFEIRKDFTSKLSLAGADIKAEVEEKLARTDLNWTVLGAPPSMEIFFAMIRGGSMFVPGGGPAAGLPTISPADLGEIAAQAALRDDLGGRRIKMVGPEAISFPDAARRISEVWGRRIRFRKIPLMFPRIAYGLSWPLAPFSDKAYFVRIMLGYIRLLNQFPQELSAEVPRLHGRLLAEFDYVPTTLEMEAACRKNG